MKMMPAPMVMWLLLVEPLIATTADAKVLRSNNKAPTVRVFKDADALHRFNRLANVGFYREHVVEALLTCRAPQGSKVEVIVSGYRTAFVRIVDGSASGCEGTVPIGIIRDQ